MRCKKYEIYEEKRKFLLSISVSTFLVQKKQTAILYVYFLNIILLKRSMVKPIKY